MAKSESSTKPARLSKKPAPPKKTKKAYKLFRTKKSQPGKLFPIFIGNQKETPVGEWVYAENLPTKGFSNRPGWHSGTMPVANHLLKKDGTLDPTRVWAEVEIPADVNWQKEADKLGRVGKKGQWIPGDIRDRVPEGGHYEFPFNVNRGAIWNISGALKITKVLTSDEVANIIEESRTSKSAASVTQQDTLTDVSLGS